MTATGSGAAFVYRFDGKSWVEEQKLTARDPRPGAHFGQSLAVEGDRVFIGAPLDRP